MASAITTIRQERAALRRERKQLKDRLREVDQEEKGLTRALEVLERHGSGRRNGAAPRRKQAQKRTRGWSESRPRRSLPENEALVTAVLERAAGHLTNMDIAARADLSTATVTRVIRSMRDRGMLYEDTVRAANGKMTPAYRLKMPSVQAGRGVVPPNK